ncbi:calcium-binding protein [Yoonia algicola]|uniref:Calcium-binding protein n=1 Tax=Yoonia algicola TaxID=3137368 RepID=A0AAN0MDD2_9RHOB
MDISIILLLLAGGALLVPLIGGDDDGDDDSGNEIRGTLDPDDPLEGTDGDDLILGFDGDDVINGGGGLDFINAGLGNDTVNGGADRDVIEGRAGDDILNGGGGNDTIDGGLDNDVINGGEGNDILRGGRGDDVIYGYTGTDLIRGAGGDDEMFLWGEQGRAIGTDGNDDLIMVTGRGFLEDDQDASNFYSFANVGDDGQTVAIVDGFGAGDQLILTLDTTDPALMDADLLVTLTEGTINDGTPGYNIEVTLAEDEVLAEGQSFEGARIFIIGSGLNPDDIENAISVDVTLNAGLTVEGAQATFDQVIAAETGANNAFTVART